MTRYAHMLGPQVQKFVEEELRLTSPEQTCLAEELALMRWAAVEATRMSVAVQSTDSSDGLKLRANEVMRCALHNVREMAVSAARVEEMNKEKVSLYAVSLFLARVLGVVRDAVDARTAEAIAVKVRAEVRLPIPDCDEDRVPTPLQLAKMMDDSISGGDDLG